MRALRESFKGDPVQVNHTRGRRLNSYFILEPEQVVADDLSHAIRAHDPKTIVRQFRSVDDVLVALQFITPKAVLANRDPSGFHVTALGQTLIAGGIPYAFLGAARENGMDGIKVLASPFTETTVAALLRHLSRSTGKSGR